MAPTIQNDPSSERERKLRAAEKKSDLVCRVKYSNTLPDIPFDPKFIIYPFLPNRFVEYKPTSLEMNYKHDLLTEHDLGVTIDLINPYTYALDPNATLDPVDEKLLEDDTLTPQDSKRSRHHNKTVPWLKKTEYISNEFNRYGHSGEKTETKVGYNVKKLFKEENMYMDRESQINAINKTFEDAKVDIDKHYSKPGVYPVEVLPVFPDFELWKYPFAQVMFDTDPAPPTQMEEMSQAMIRGVMDESGEQFVAYFLPTEETTKKRKRDAEEGVEYMDEDEYEYKMAREYNWNVKNKASKGYEENYFFVFRDGALYYNELETRVRLSKRRALPGMPPNNSLLVVRHRPLNEGEFNQQKARMCQLEAPVGDEEEEEEEAGEEQEQQEEMEQDEEGENENEASEESGAEEQVEEAEERTRAESDEEEAKSDAESVEEAKSDAESADEAKSDAESADEAKSDAESADEAKSEAESADEAKSEAESAEEEEGRASRGEESEQEEARSENEAESSEEEKADSEDGKEQQSENEVESEEEDDD